MRSEISSIVAANVSMSTAPQEDWDRLRLLLGQLEVGTLIHVWQELNQLLTVDVQMVTLAGHHFHVRTRPNVPMYLLANQVARKMNTSVGPPCLTFFVGTKKLKNRPDTL